MAKKPLDRAAKEKRQKIILAVGGVLLVGLLAFQGPKTLKMLNAKPPADESHATTTDTTAAAVGTVPSGPGGIETPATAATATAAPTVQATAVVTPGGIGIANTTQPAVPDAGQLVSFSRFKSKDPFVQQVTTDSGSASTTSSTTPATATATASPPATSAVPSAPSAPSSPPANVVPVAPAAPAAKPTSAQISVDGTAENVGVKASFPKASPTFTLVSLTATTAKIGIVGGTYSGGGPTITLKRGKTVTLMNTVDGTRYKLRLVSVS